MTVQEKELFLQYIDPQLNGAGRAEFIQNQLNQYGLDCPVLALEGKNHLYVKFPVNQYNPMFKIKTVITHYDRVEGSPGANDNSLANFCVLQWAKRLSRMQKPHNMRIIFTDGEELGQGGVSEQGAFALAQLYKRLGLANDEIYVFDSMGRGTIPIICNNNLPAKVSSSFASRMNALENKAEKLVSSSCGGRWFKLNCNYSDNASFIANGIPAVAITMLPSDEVNSYVKNGLEPLTWSMFHTAADNFENLTPQSYDLFSSILNLLAIQKTLTDV